MLLEVIKITPCSNKEYFPGPRHAMYSYVGSFSTGLPSNLRIRCQSDLSVLEDPSPLVIRGDGLNVGPFAINVRSVCEQVEVITGQKRTNTFPEFL